MIGGARSAADSPFDSAAVDIVVAAEEERQASTSPGEQLKGRRSRSQGAAEAWPRARVAPRCRMAVATLLRLAIPYHRDWGAEGRSVIA